MSDKKSLRELMRDGTETLRVLHKNRIYEQDMLKEADLKAILDLEEKWTKALKEKNADALSQLDEETAKLNQRLFKLSEWSEWKENVEVFVVAIVVALAIRSFFLQPFKIPTGSMEPTLNGQQLKRTMDPADNYFVQLALVPFTGKWHTYFTVPNGGEIRQLTTRQYTPLFEFTDVTIGEETFTIWANADALRKIGIREGEFVPSGSIINFRSEAGDQVLVNKVALNFRLPHRGEVFVFKTSNIRYLEWFNSKRGIDSSQYYIKRCIGVPGDEIRVAQPYLEINGKRADQSPTFEKIFSMQNGYNGYVNEPHSTYLQTAANTVHLDKDQFWAMGDNSRNSLDSRYWGPVPRENLVGTGWVVYWPFAAHWGWIR